METNLISSNKITLNITTPQGAEVSLNKGEVLQAQVQEVGEDGSVTILVKGKPIEAFTEVAVKPGQQLMLIVDDVKQGKTYLKVVTPELMGKIENTNISANLQEMGITAREANIALARKLLQYNLPVNQNNLNELNRNVNLLGGANARNLEIGAFALSRGITGKEALQALSQFLSVRGDTAKLMPVLNQLLNALAIDTDSEPVNRAGSAWTAQPESSKLNGQFNQLNQALDSLLNEKGSQMTAEKSSTAQVVNKSEAAINGIPASAARQITEAANQSAGASKSSMVTTGGGNGPAPINTPEVSVAGNKAPEILITGNKPNNTSGNNSDPAVPVRQAGNEEETAGPNAKASPVGTKADNSQTTSPSRTTVGSPDKLINTTVQGEEAITPASSGNEKVAAEKTAGLVNKSPLSNVEGREPELSVKNNQPAMTANQADKAAAPKIVNQTIYSTAAEIPVQDEQPVSASQANAADSGDDPVLGPAMAAVEEEAMERLLGRENNTAGKLIDADPLPARDALKSEVFKMLDAVRNLMEIDLEAAPDKIAGKLQGIGNSEKDVVRALSLLVDMAKNQDIVKIVPELKDFSVGLDRLEKEITGQQLFNVSSRNPIDNMSGFYYFAFPVKIDQQYSLCQLKINKDGRKSLKDVDKLSFVVALDTNKLGEVLFHINWQKSGSLQLQGVVETQASCDFLNQNIGELVDKLEGLGYRVKNLGVKVSSTPEEMRIRPVLQEVNEPLRPLGIDVTV